MELVLILIRFHLAGGLSESKPDLSAFKISGMVLSFHPKPFYSHTHTNIIQTKHTTGMHCIHKYITFP